MNKPNTRRSKSQNTQQGQSVRRVDVPEVVMKDPMPDKTGTELKGFKRKRQRKRFLETHNLILKHSPVPMIFRVVFRIILLVMFSIATLFLIFFLEDRFEVLEYEFTATFVQTALLFLFIFVLVNIVVIILMVRAWLYTYYEIKQHSINYVRRRIFFTTVTDFEINGPIKLRLYQGIFGKIFDYGNIEVTLTALDDDVLLRYIPTPRFNMKVLEDVFLRKEDEGLEDYVVTRS
jgi:hypothetical protein